MQYSTRQIFKKYFESAFFLSFFYFFCFASIQAQITAEAALDSTNLLIGDQVQLHIRVNHSADVQVTDLDVSALQEAKGFEVITIGTWDTLSPALLQKNITIQSFDSGYHFIPSLAIDYSRAGEISKVKTQQLAFTVSTIPQDSLDLAPIKYIEEEARRLEDYAVLLLVVLAFALLAILVRYVLKRRQEGEQEVVVPEIKLPAHEIAMQQLKELKAAQLWQNGKIKPYHSRLTHIVREYLENRYNVQALEMTTDQILQQLEILDTTQEKFDTSWRDRLREMLQAADLVKFAKAQPAMEFHDQMMNYAEQFVQETQKIEIPLEEQEEAPSN